MTDISELVLQLLNKYEVRLKQSQIAELVKKIDGTVNHLVRGSYSEGYEDGKDAEREYNRPID